MTTMTTTTENTSSTTNAIFGEDIIFWNATMMDSDELSSIISQSIPRENKTNTDIFIDKSDDTIWTKLDQVYLILTCIILVIGSIGNMMVIGAVLSHRKLRNLGNVFIVNLAVADFTVSSFINAFAILALVTKGEYFEPRRHLCEFVASVCVITCVCSVWSIASISVNRYVRICHHVTYPVIYNKRSVGCIVAGLWLCCFIIDFPNIIGGWGGHDFDNKLMMCTYDHQGSNYGSTVFFIGLGFGFPWLVTVYAYLRIFLFVRKKRQALKDSQNNGRVAPNKRMGISNADISLLRSTFTIFVLFFVMWSPYALIVLCDPPHKWPDEIYVVAGFFAHTNSSINSILYAVTNKNFRDGYMKILRCRCRNVRVGTEMSTVLTVATGKQDVPTSDSHTTNPSRTLTHQ